MIKTLLLVSILSSGVQYQTEYDNIEDCLKAKEEIIQVNPEGVEAYCVTKSERQQTQVDRDMEEASKRLTRTIISTFQSIMTKVMIDIQREQGADRVALIRTGWVLLHIITCFAIVLNAIQNHGLKLLGL